MAWPVFCHISGSHTSEAIPLCGSLCINRFAALYEQCGATALQAVLAHGQAPLGRHTECMISAESECNASGPAAICCIPVKTSQRHFTCTDHHHRTAALATMNALAGHAVSHAPHEIPRRPSRMRRPSARVRSPSPKALATRGRGDGAENQPPANSVTLNERETSPDYGPGKRHRRPSTMYRPPETLTAARASSPPRRSRRSEDRPRPVRRSEEPIAIKPAADGIPMEPPTFTRHGERHPRPTRRRAAPGIPVESGDSSSSDDSSDDEIGVVARTPVTIREDSESVKHISDKESIAEVSDDEDFHVTMLVDSELDLAPSDATRCSSEPQSLPPMSTRAPTPESASPTTPACESRDEVFSHALPQPSPPAHEGAHAGELTLSLPYHDGELVSKDDAPLLPECSLPSDLFDTSAAPQSPPSTAVEHPVPDMSYVEVTSAPSHIASALFVMKRAGACDDLEGFDQATMMGLTELDRAWGAQSDALPMSKRARRDDAPRTRAHLARMRSRK